MPTLSLNHDHLKAFFTKTNAFTLVYYISFLDHNKVNNLNYSQFFLCILIFILLYIVKSSKIFDFDCKSKSILTFIVVDFNYFILYKKNSTM